MIKSWVGLWSIPSMTSLNPTGSRAGLGKCGRTWGGADSRARFLASSRGMAVRNKSAQHSQDLNHIACRSDPRWAYRGSDI